MLEGSGCFGSGCVLPPIRGADSDAQRITPAGRIASGRHAAAAQAPGRSCSRHHKTRQTLRQYTHIKGGLLVAPLPRSSWHNWVDTCSLLACLQARPARPNGDARCCPAGGGYCPGCRCFAAWCGCRCHGACHDLCRAWRQCQWLRCARRAVLRRRALQRCWPGMCTCRGSAVCALRRLWL